MEAIRVDEFGEPEVLRLEEVPTPQPGVGQVLVRMHAVGVNPVETYIRAGKYARLPALPYTPGNDGAGVIEQVDPDVKEFKAGDRVYTAGSMSGTYAEFALCNTAQVHRCRRMFLSRKAQLWVRRTRLRIAGCSNAPMRSRVKLCLCTARAAGSA